MKLKPNLNIKNAEERHKPFFWALYVDSMKPHIEKIWGWDPEWQKKDFENRWSSCLNKIVLLDRVPIGYIQTQTLTDSLYIMMFIISSDFRNKGVGKEVLDILGTTCEQSLIRLRVFKTNLKALKFYNDIGYDIVEKEDSFYLLERVVS